MIASKIKEIREKNGLNKREMSKKLNIPYTTYNNYETGNREPGSDFLIKFSNEFGISIDYIMGNTANNQSFINGYKKNDAITDIILQLRSDFELLAMTAELCKLTPEQRAAVQSVLSAFNSSK